MEDEAEKKIKMFSDLTKTFLLLGTTLVGITLYVHTTFATNNRVDRIENEQMIQRNDISNQQKISCQIAIAVGVSEEKLPHLCQLDVK